MTDKEKELLDALQKLADGCRAYPNAQRWVNWFEEDRSELQSSLERNDSQQELRLLADLRRALWGGMGAFCDGGAPNKELEELGNRTYRLVNSIEAAKSGSKPPFRFWDFFRKK